MPVEIKELVIRAVVAPPEEAARARARAQRARAAASDAAGLEAVVEAAVKEVLRVLRASKER
ncbi:DUF5908 family protein [Sorangium sp. So ce394]|uniref:DUF5908 family protein n=1 Tax=Sorangium sp. So ce394 TaxID=3133310 RepID=UPI003F5C0F98